MPICPSAKLGSVIALEPLMVLSPLILASAPNRPATPVPAPMVSASPEMVTGPLMS
jgi:hypothetical protein